ncbi:MAG: nuclear transport factor 2 family protein [Acidobacteriota bacterium]
MPARPKPQGGKRPFSDIAKLNQSEGREMGSLTFSDLQIEMLGPGGAFVRGRWHLRMSAGEAGGLFTLIFRRFSDGWKIIHDHTGSQ